MLAGIQPGEGHELAPVTESADVTTFRQQMEECQAQMTAQPAISGSLVRHPAVSGTTGPVPTAASTLPQPDSPTTDDVALEQLLTCVASGEHRESILEGGDSTRVNQTVTQGLLVRMEVAVPLPARLVEVSAEGQAWLAARGVGVTANPRLGALRARGLSMNAICAVLWAAAALGDIYVTPPFIGDVQPAIDFQGQPVLVADSQVVPSARQLAAVLKATGCHLWLLAIDKRSQTAVISQANLARDDYLAEAEQAVTIGLTNTASLVNGNRHADGSIWIWQMRYPAHEGVTA